MPTPNDVVKAFYDKKFANVIQLIKQDKKLVNSAADEKSYPLFQLALTGSQPGDERQQMLEFMVTHPELNFSHKRLNGNATNISMLIDSARLDLLKLVTKRPEILASEDKLSYQIAKESLERTKKLLVRSEKRDPNSESCQQYRKEISVMPEMISLLRDATILQAIAKDDADLLVKLEKAGDNPTQSMGTLGAGKPLNMVITKSHTNIRSWLNNRTDMLLKSITDNPNSLFNRAQKLKELEAQKLKLEQEYLITKAGLFSKSIEGSIARAEKVLSNPITTTNNKNK